MEVGGAVDKVSIEGGYITRGIGGVTSGENIYVNTGVFWGHVDTRSITNSVSFCRYSVTCKESKTVSNKFINSVNCNKLLDDP